MNQEELLKVTVEDGKYTVIQEKSGRLMALRYGQPWRDCNGDGLIHALAYEVDELRKERDQIAKLIGVHPGGPELLVVIERLCEAVQAWKSIRKY